MWSYLRWPPVTIVVVGRSEVKVLGWYCNGGQTKPAGAIFLSSFPALREYDTAYRLAPSTQI